MPIPSDLAPNSLDITDTSRVITFILDSIKENAPVYPSEQYFYYKFKVGPRLISGNLRFCNSKNGVVNFGYFDEFDPKIIFHGAIRNGVNGVVEKSHDKVKLIFAGRTRNFSLSKTLHPNSHPPIKIDIAEDEELITQVQDESGFAFSLFYRGRSRQFYYCLRYSPENLIAIKIGGADVFLGDTSRFAFVQDDLGRKVLIGVLHSEVESNTYFDGPFDQVPPFLDIKD